MVNNGTGKAPGRKRKYTKKTFYDAVCRYFDSISRTVTVMDGQGHVIYNDAGEEIRTVQYAVPPGITDLCLHLGIDRSTWQNYANRDLYPELADICEYARDRIIAYLERELNVREKGTQGIAFNLQNNYGWKQVQEVELGEKTRKSVEKQMSYRDKLEFLRRVTGAETKSGEAEEDGIFGAEPQRN